MVADSSGEVSKSLKKKWERNALGGSAVKGTSRA